MKKLFFTFFSLILVVSGLSAQKQLSKQPHQDELTDIFSIRKDENDSLEYFTTSKDGFVIKWNEEGTGEHYQITDLGISKIAVSPDGKYIAVVETDGGSFYKVTAWEWGTLTKVFSKKYDETVNTITFSAKGTYLVICSSTFDAIEFVKTEDWQIMPDFIVTGMMANFAYISNTEKNAVFYAPSGKLVYFNLNVGKSTKNIFLEKGLSQPVLFHKANFFAGILENKILIFDSISGKKVKEIPVVKPYILSNEKDNDLIYIDSDAKGNYSYKMVTVTEQPNAKDPSKTDKIISSAKTIASISLPKELGAISSVYKTNNNIIIGSKNGLLCNSTLSEEEKTLNFEIVAAPIYDKIIDIAKYNGNYYFLTNSAVFKGNFQEDTVPEKIADNTQGQKELVVVNDESVILYTPGVKASINMINTTTNTKSQLFSTKNRIQLIKFFKTENKEYLTVIENTDTVYVYDFEKKTYKEMYKGSGIRDTVIINDKTMFISKSASTTPKAPLIKVDLGTKESSGTPVMGSTCYSIDTDGSKIYGISLQNNNSENNTYVFCYDPEENKAYNMLKYDDEDTSAFVSLNSNTMYSNIGKGQIYCYNMGEKRRYILDRDIAFPRKLLQNEEWVCIMNADGSVSLYKPGETTSEKVYYFSLEGEWVNEKQ